MAVALPRVSATWAASAVLLGIAAARLPLPLFIGVIGAVGLCAVFLIEPAFALIFTLCIAPLKTLVETESPVQLPLDIGQLALGLFIGAWLLRRASERDWRLAWSLPLLGAVGLFTLAASLSLWTALSAGYVITELLKWVQILILIAIVPNLRRWRMIVFGVVLSAVLQAIIGVWQFRGGSGAAHLWLLDYRFFRAFGTFGQPNPFGGFMGMILPLSLALAVGYLYTAYTVLNTGRVTTRWQEPMLLAALYGSMAGIILVGLLTSWSRGAWLGFLGAATVMIWLFPARRLHGTLLLAAGGVLISMLWLAGLLPASLTSRLTSFSEDFTGVADVRGVVISDPNYAVIERLAHWQSAISMAETSPLLGVGFNNYEVAYPQHKLINWQFALGHAHNYYLNLLAETGIIGLTAYLIMWSIIIACTLRWLHQPGITWEERGLLIGLMGVWTHIAIHSFIDKLYVNNLFLHVGVLLGLLAGIQFKNHVNNERNDPHKSY